MGWHMAASTHPDFIEHTKLGLGGQRTRRSRSSLRPPSTVKSPFVQSHHHKQNDFLVLDALHTAASPAQSELLLVLRLELPEERNHLRRRRRDKLQRSRQPVAANLEIPSPDLKCDVNHKMSKCLNVL